MQLHPIKASEWFSLSEANKQLLKRYGAVAINDCFFDLIGNRPEIRLLYGSYGSGKSIFEAQDLIHECRTSKYFKCYYGRKVFDTVRGSIFETIVDTIEDLGLGIEFNYSRANTSSMHITHIATGNKFYPFGSDKAEKLKSIKDPTHILCEEFDQFSEEDFQLIFPRLRTSKGVNHFVGMFNTAAVRPTHWLLKYFFPDFYKGDDKSTIDILEGVSIEHMLANYNENWFIDQDAYYKRLKLASGGNTLILDAIANGKWGVDINNDPWLHAFDIKKHIAFKKIDFLPSYPVYLSFDFNRDPVTCTAYQMSPNAILNVTGSFVHVIKEFAYPIQLHELCDRIKAQYPNSIIYVTGDRTGKNGNVGFEQRNMNYYTIIKTKLGISDRLINIAGKNLIHNDSRLLCNTVLTHHPNFKICPEGCPTLLNECQSATVDEKSKDAGVLKKDREQYKMDVFDGFRYFIQTYFEDYTKRIGISNLK